MRRFLRLFLVASAAAMPFGLLRRVLYGFVPGYGIHHGARIGWLAFIDVESLRMDDGSAIGRRTVARGPMTMTLGGRAALGSHCTVTCGEWWADVERSETPYRREFVLGEDARTTRGHFFDAVGGLVIGQGTWIAGRGSQFWTHGLGATDRAITIGRYCYIGSAARFAPGARIGDLCVVALGSVVIGDLSSADRALIAGVPAKVRERPYRPTGWRHLEEAIASGKVTLPEQESPPADRTAAGSDSM